MAYLHFDRNYAPCSVLIVRDGGDPYNDGDTVLIQGDDDMRAVAETIGWHEDDNELEPSANWHDFLRSFDGPDSLPDMAAASLDEYLPADDGALLYVPSAAEARAIAADWHSGQWSALYAFASSGTILPELRAEVQTELDCPRIGDAPQASLQHLLNFIESAESAE